MFTMLIVVWPAFVIADVYLSWRMFAQVNAKAAARELPEWKFWAGFRGTIRRAHTRLYPDSLLQTWQDALRVTAIAVLLLFAILRWTR